MARYSAGNDFWLTIQLIEICLIAATSHGCNLVSVKFSIGIVDEDSTYQNHTNFSVVLQYRNKRNDEWMTEWSKTVYSNGIVETVELNLTLPSNVPQLQLKWLQNASSYAPTLFINDVIIKGIVSEDMKNKNSRSNCKLNKVIDFNEDGLNYLLCTEAKVNKDGLLFGGQNSKQVTLCTFNLASGNCIGLKNTCTASSEVSPTATSLSMVRSITSMALTVTNFHTMMSTNIMEMPQSAMNTTVSSVTQPLSTTVPISTTSSSKLTMSSSIELLSTSTVVPVEFPSTSLSMSTNIVAPSTTLLGKIRSITSMALTVTDFHTMASTNIMETPQSAMNTISDVITSTIISNSASSFVKTVSGVTQPPSATMPISAISSSKLTISSSIELLSTSTMVPLEFSSTPLSTSTNVVAPFSAELSSMSMSMSSFSKPVSPSPGPTGRTLSVSETDTIFTDIISSSFASLSFQSSSATLLPGSMSVKVDIVPSPSSRITQSYDKSVPLLSVVSNTIQPPSSITISTSIPLLSPSSTTSHIINEISGSMLPSNSTKLSISKSVSVPISTIMTINVVVSTERIHPTASVTILDTENCAEEIFNNTRRKAQPLHSTRRLFCSDSNSFITQVCSKRLTTDQAAWYPDLPDSCKNGLLISDRLYFMAVMNATIDEPIQVLITPMKDFEILSGDVILLSNLLARRTSCSDNDEEIGALNVLLSSQYISAVEQLEERDQLRFVNNIFFAADFYGFNCYNQTFSFKTTSVNLIVVRTNLMERLIDHDMVLSHDDGSSFVLPTSVLAAAQKENHHDFQAVSYRFAGLNTILSRPLAKNDLQYQNGSIYQLGSPVISLSISCSSENCANALKKDGVQIAIVHDIQIHQENDATCAFWNYSISNEYKPFWSTRGCEVKECTANLTVCKCYHLTHFGILFDATGRSSAKINSENRVALSVITHVGVSLSLVALICTIVSMMIFRSQWDLRVFVHINLCSTLFIAQLIFTVAVDKTSNSVGCATVAILLQYFFIISFMWTLMEGVVLHIMLVNVFSFKHIGRRYYIGFTLLCYGGPLLYMALCVPLGLARTNEWSYGSDYFCWLTYHDNFIWAFIAPVLLILLINIGFLAMSLKIMRRHLHDKTKTPWYWFRGSMSLIVIMGINWILGLLVLHEYLLPIIYLFAITTALQGVWIFLLFTVGSRQMREEYSKLLKSLQSKISESTIIGNSKITPCFDVVPENDRKGSHQKANNNYEMHEMP